VHLFPEGQFCNQMLHSEALPVSSGHRNAHPDSSPPRSRAVLALRPDSEEVVNALDEDDAATFPPVDACSAIPGSTTLAQPSSKDAAQIRQGNSIEIAVYPLSGTIAAPPRPSSSHDAGLEADELRPRRPPALVRVAGGTS